MVNKRVPCFHSLCISIIGFVWRKKEGNRKQKSDQLQLCPVSLFYIEFQSIPILTNKHLTNLIKLKVYLTT